MHMYMKSSETLQYLLLERWLSPVHGHRNSNRILMYHDAVTQLCSRCMSSLQDVLEIASVGHD